VPVTGCRPRFNGVLEIKDLSGALARKREMEGTMVAKIRKWGNSLALCIPRMLAEEADLHDGSVVELRLKPGKLVISPASPTLAELLQRVTKNNLHGEIDPGPARRREAW
jgi:antitoxin MazE